MDQILCLDLRVQTHKWWSVNFYHCASEQKNKQKKTSALNDYLKKKNCSPSGHPKCKWVCFFMGTDLVTCSPMDPLHWMGAVRMRVQTADPSQHHNNPQVIHTTSVHQLMSWEDKSCMFVRNKSIDVFKFKLLLLAESSPLFIILLSPVTKPSCLNQERNLHRSSTVYKWK